MLQFSTSRRNKILVAHKKLVFYFVINYVGLILFLIICHWVKIISQQEAQYLLSGCAVSDTRFLECVSFTVLVDCSWVMVAALSSFEEDVKKSIQQIIKPFI